jgi:hypothetical protein
MTAKDKRLLAQAERALLRVSDWLYDLDDMLDGQDLDKLGVLIQAVEIAQERT